MDKLINETMCSQLCTVNFMSAVTLLSSFSDLCGHLYDNLNRRLTVEEKYVRDIIRLGRAVSSRYNPQKSSISKELVQKALSAEESLKHLWMYEGIGVVASGWNAKMVELLNIIIGRQCVTEVCVNSEVWTCCI